MLIAGPFERHVRVPCRGPVEGPPVVADVRLRALFEADQRYVRRRRRRRYLQAALAVSLPLPVAALSWQHRLTPALVIATISAWATLVALTNLLIMWEWVSCVRIVEAADELIDGTRSSPIAHGRFLGTSDDEIRLRNGGRNTGVI